MAVYHTVDGQPYSVTAGTDVTVTDADGLILGVSAGGQGSFVGNGGDVTITGEHHFVQIKGGGGGGGNGGGGGEPFDGNLDADLHVGLQPAVKATGSVQVADADAAGVLKIGDVATVEFEKNVLLRAYIDFTPLDEYDDAATYVIAVGPYSSPTQRAGVCSIKNCSSAEDVVECINDISHWRSFSAMFPVFYTAKAELLPSGKVRVYFQSYGATGNSYSCFTPSTLAVPPFEDMPKGPNNRIRFAGGEGSARTVSAIINTINSSSASDYVEASIYSDSILLTARVPGSEVYPLSVEGGMFSDPQDIEGGYPARNIYVNESKVYGSTDVIYPETELPADNILRHGHIYLVTADQTTTSLSLLQAEQYGRMSIWLDYTSGSVTWPSKWSWANGLMPDNLTSGSRYFIELFSDGVAEIATFHMAYTHG